jgi:hypothetical protein
LALKVRWLADEADATQRDLVIEALTNLVRQRLAAMGIDPDR